jgi:pimeloyl-ACP methyl ester carboxylesterase
MIHDIGSDIDEFAGLAEVLAERGYDVTALDLPGHGLSDGGSLDPRRCLAIVAEVVAAIAAGGRCGLVCIGRMASVATALGDADGAAAQILINPVLDDEIASAGSRAHAVRMVLHGEGANLVGTRTQKFFSYLIGEKLLLYNPELAGGVGAVTAVPALQAHVELFFHRYLESPTFSNLQHEE